MMNDPAFGTFIVLVFWLIAVTLLGKRSEEMDDE